MSYDSHKNRSYNYFSADDIMRWITDEVNDTTKLTEDIIEEAAEYGRARLEHNSPVSTDNYKSAKGEYAKSWKVRKVFPKGYNSSGENVGKKYNIKNATGRLIYNEIGKLTHILENGTNERYTRLGYKRGKGKPRRHIENAFKDTLEYLNTLINNN